MKAIGDEKTPAGFAASDISRQIFWNIIAANKYLEDMLKSWSRQVGVSGAHGLILMAIMDLDQGEGVSVSAVSAKLHVGAAFVTAQTKFLERQGFLKRLRSGTDARMVLMSLADGRKSEISVLLERWDAIHELIFSDFSASTWIEMRDKLDVLKRRYEIACKRVMDQYIGDQ